MDSRHKDTKKNRTEQGKRVKTTFFTLLGCVLGALVMKLFLCKVMQKIPYNLGPQALKLDQKSKKQEDVLKHTSCA